jgi:hypothetical protein
VQQKDEPSLSPLAVFSLSLSLTPATLLAVWHCSKKGHKPKRVHGHHFVCLCELELMCLWLHKKDLLHFLLRRGQLRCLTEESAIKVAEELQTTPHKLIYWHKCGLLGNAKPTNQLVADVQKPGNCLEVIPDALVKVFLCEVRIVGALFAHNVGPLCETNILETLAPIRLNSVGPSSFLVSEH